MRSHRTKVLKRKSEVNIVVKMFKFPTFEEWTSNGRKFEDGIGAYKCQLKSFCWSRISTTYMFAVALSNTNPSNIYTNKLFCKSFEYIEGNNEEEFKIWYNDTIDEFNRFWITYIKSVYLINTDK